MKTNCILAAGIFFSVLAASCGSSTTVQLHQPPSNRIYGDMTLKPLLEAEQLAFEGLRDKEKLNLSVLTEDELFRAFMQDSVRFIVASRKLNELERKSLQQRQLVYNETKIATDAIALIVGNKFPIDNLSYSQLHDIVNGSITNGQQLSSKLPASELKIVFDHPHSSIIRQFDDSLLRGRKRPATFFALGSPGEVVDYVEKNENSIGLIGMSWISEHNDTTAGSFLDRIKVLELENPYNHEYYLPLQGYIATKEYALIREVFVITLGNTVRFPFGNYLTNDKGQRVVLKEGLIPATMPLRLVKIEP
ncbi:MAG: substrate-binding domain-containing protein [Bacteroidia bacterium]|nr:substrate-binding domain-containing protein [Bacteroidia bacterium]